MKTLHNLMQEIIELTAHIETNYPELYKYLEETPMVLSDGKAESISSLDLVKYLETLKAQLMHHMETHRDPMKNDSDSQ